MGRASGGGWIMAETARSRCGHLGDEVENLIENGFDRRRVWDCESSWPYDYTALRQKFHLTVARSLSRRVSFVRCRFAMWRRRCVLKWQGKPVVTHHPDGYDFHAFWSEHGQPSYVVQASCIRSAGKEGKKEVVMMSLNAFA